MRIISGAFFVLMLLALACLGGCTNTYNLRYQANPQPKGANLFADFTPLQDGIGVSVDTDGKRLEDIYVKKGDTIVHPTTVANAPYYQSAALGTGVGGFGDHVGGGVGLGIPIGPKESHGLTSATFNGAAIGAAPWELHVKVKGADEAVIPGFGGKPTAK